MIVSFTITKAQNIVRIDSLRNVIRVDANDTIRQQTLTELSIEIYLLNPDSSLVRAQEALYLAKRMNYDRGIAEAHRVTGICLQRMGRLSQCIREYLLAIEYFQAHNDSAGLFKTYNSLGLAASQSGSQQEGLTYYDRARQYYNPNEPFLSSLYTNRSLAFFAMGRWDSAYTYADWGLKAAQNIQLIRAYPFAMLAKANAWIELGEADSAKVLIDSAKIINDRLNNTLVEHLYDKALAHWYSYKANKDSALYAFTKSIESARRSGHIYFVRDAYIGIIRYASRERMPLLAIAYQDTLNALQKQLQNTETNSATDDLEEEIRRLDDIAQLKLSEQKIRQTQTFVYWGIAFIGFAGLLGIILLRVNRKEHEAQLYLQEEAKELEEQKHKLAEKTEQIFLANKSLEALNSELHSINTELQGANTFKLSMIRLLSHDLKIAIDNSIQAVDNVELLSHVLRHSLEHSDATMVQEEHSTDVVSKKILSSLEAILEQVDNMVTLIQRELSSVGEQSVLIQNPEHSDAMNGEMNEEVI